MFAHAFCGHQVWTPLVQTNTCAMSLDLVVYVGGQSSPDQDTTVDFPFRRPPMQLDRQSQVIDLLRSSDQQIDNDN